MRTLLAIVAILVLAVLVAGCNTFQAGGPRGNPEVGAAYPDGCGEFGLSARWCKAILDWAVAQPDVGGRAITAIAMLGDPQCGVRADGTIPCIRTTQFVVRMRLHLVDGAAVDESVFCGVGGQYSILCTETPEIMLTGPTLGGYWDGPGMTAPPTPPQVRDAARPLHLAALDIGIGHVGHYEIDMGRAVVPLGILTHANVTLGNPKTQAVTLAEGGLNFVIRSTQPGAKPFDNLYVRGWHDGTEEVSALLIFDVTSFEPGAVLQLRDLVVE